MFLPEIGMLLCGEYKAPAFPWEDVPDEAGAKGEAADPVESASPPPELVSGVSPMRIDL